MNINSVHDSIPKCDKKNSILNIAKCVWDILTEKSFDGSKEDILLQLCLLNAPLSLDLLQSWTSVVDCSLISLSLVYRICKANDDKALSLLSQLCKDDSTAFVWEIISHKKKEMNIDVCVTTLDDGQQFAVKALLDSRCTDSSIDRKFIAKHQINTHKFLFPKPTSNTDGTPNKNGAITNFIIMCMEIQDHCE